MAKQLRWWDFLTPVTYNKFTGWLQHIVPAGVYKGGSIRVDDQANKILLEPTKFVLPSGRTVEELETLPFNLPTVSLNTVSEFTLITYGSKPNTTKSTEVRYLVNEGFLTNELLQTLTYVDFELPPDDYEFMVLGWLTFDGADWSTLSVPMSVVDATNRQQQIVVPFQHELISTTGSWEILVDDTYGPVYANTGVTEILVGCRGVVETANLRIIGATGGEVKVTLLPGSYQYVESFPVTSPTLVNLLINPVFQDNPTLGNTAMILRFTGNVKLLDIQTNQT